MLLAAGVRVIRVRLLSTVNTGPDNDGYYDDLRLELIVAPPPPITEIPTLSEWGMGLLILLLLGLGVVKSRP